MHVSRPQLGAAARDAHVGWLRWRAVTSYRGPATITLPDETQEEGVVNLRTEQTGDGLSSWFGTFRGSNPSADLLNAMGPTLQLKLPNGRTGQVLIQNVGGDGRDFVFNLIGSGPAPF
jgi:hypothetical protein